MLMNLKGGADPKASYDVTTPIFYIVIRQYMNTSISLLQIAYKHQFKTTTLFDHTQL